MRIIYEIPFKCELYMKLFLNADYIWNYFYILIRRILQFDWKSASTYLKMSEYVIGFSFNRIDFYFSKDISFNRQIDFDGSEKRAYLKIS